ncbi:MAG: metallophosphoesterase family protein [Candidatus Brocadiia bacterium]
MRIVALTDLHGSAKPISTLAEPISEADLVLLCGDLTNFGGRRQAADILEAALELNDGVLAVPGNCDRPEVEHYLAAQNVSIHAAHRVRDGVAFLGLGGSLPCPANTPYEFGEEELAESLGQAARGLDPDLSWVLVSHQPPQDTAVDRVRSGQHVGSRSVREFIERHRPLVCFSGHTHESIGTDSIGPTRLANPGPAREGGCVWAEIEDGELTALELRSGG